MDDDDKSNENTDAANNGLINIFIYWRINIVMGTGLWLCK